MQSTRNGNSTKVIANHGEGAVNIINKYGNDAVQALVKCSNPGTVAGAIRLMKNNTYFIINAPPFYKFWINQNSTDLNPNLFLLNYRR